jgi:MFS family permease
MLCLDGTRDGDLYLQLASGRFVAAHGVSLVDPFRTIAHGEPWLNQQWLDELLAFRVASWVGVTGLTVAYALLLAAPLALLLWLCRRKGPAMMVALTVLYCPGLWLIVHPRAAGFSLLAFSLLVVVLALAWLWRGPEPPPLRLRWAVPATLVVFALWANLHGGFLAGLLLIGLAVGGLALERRLGGHAAADGRRIALLALTGVLAVATVVVATPLGGALLTYLESFRNPEIAAVSSEWKPALGSPLAVAYVLLAAGFAGRLWLRAPGARSPTPALVAVAFLALALISLRNLVFVGPAIALAIALLAPDRPLRVPWPLVGALLAASAGAAVTWALAVGPPRNEPILERRLVGYAVHHPPSHGHIASYAGIGSYMLWRSPRAPVELDGWLEHFSAAELRGTYAVLDGHLANPTGLVRRLRIGAVIADRAVAIRALRRHGFRLAYRTPGGSYLVRRSPPAAAQASSGAGSGSAIPTPWRAGSRRRRARASDGVSLPVTLR